MAAPVGFVGYRVRDMGCTSCKSKAGCDHRKGEMIASVDRALERLYPTRT